MTTPAAHHHRSRHQPSSLRIPLRLDAEVETALAQDALIGWDDETTAEAYATIARTAWRQYADLMTVSSAFGHPRWGLQFHWWAVDPFSRVGLFYSSFGPVPSAANAHEQTLDEATAWAKTRHPEWFDAQCGEDDCPTYCVVELARAPYLFTWAEEHDDRYYRYGVPTQPLLVSELPAAPAAAVRLVAVDFSFAQAERIDLGYPGGREVISASAPAPCMCCQRHPVGQEQPTVGELGVA